ncbi:MAG: T9SS type A sorting domain-containing protein [Bacteroidota bacterium]
MGIKKINLTATTDKSCESSFDDLLFIVPIDTPKKYTFNSANGDGWIGLGTNSSWGLGSKGGDVIVQGPEPERDGDRFWVTGVDTTYNKNEESFLYSPIFDLSGLERPLIEMNTFNHFFPGSDGAVLQYAIGGTELTREGRFKDWEILGEIGSGVQWYNQNNIQNAPGDQVTELLGWSAADDMWRKSKHAVSIEKGDLESDEIQFRIAFKSGIPPASGATFDGFAIDNFSIGERNRIVLIENFTNTSPSDTITRSESDFLRDLLNSTGDAVEYVNINYHTDFPGPDPINSVNRAVPGARAVYYDISETPRAIIDGTISQDDLFSNWGLNELQLRSLNSAPYNISIDPSQGANGILDIEVQITADSVEGENLLVYAAILERQVTLQELTERGLNVSTINSGENVFDFTLREMLPNAAGFQLSTGDFSEDNELEPISFSWAYSLIALDDISVVVFIQDEETREVYQAEIVDVAAVLSPVTGIDDLLNKDIAIFPNPANDRVIVSFGRSINTDASIRIYNNFGQLVSEQNIAAGTNQVEINTKDYTAGIYHVQMFIGEEKLEIKRLMITH